MIHSVDRKPRKILGACIAISLAIHTLFLSFLQRHSLWFYSRVSSEIVATSFCLDETVPRNQILKETFSSNWSKTDPIYQPQQESLSFQLIRCPLPIQVPPESAISLPIPPIDDLLSDTIALFPVPSFSIPSIKSFDFFADLPKDLLIPSADSLPSRPFFSPSTEQIAATALKAPAASHPESPFEPLLAFSLPAADSLPKQEETPLSKNLPTIPLPRLPRLPSLVDLATVNLSEVFEAELTFLPRPEGSGYLFALTLLPKADLHIPKIQQRVTFLIDRSNSIQRERLLASKQAILRALEELDAEDSFNIIAFDNKTEKLFPTLVSPTPDAISKAENFLDAMNLGSFFSTSDLYKPLLLTIPSRVQENELFTAILLTDGEGLAKKQNQHLLLHDWTLQNRGRVSLYAIGMERDAHLDTLEMICSLNRGSLYQSTTQRGLKRQLLKLAKTIQTPLAKNLSLKAISRSSNNRIEIHPRPSLAPHLYLNQPYVILGTTETLDDFMIFIQGKLKDKWLNIKKPISFLNAKRGGNSLKAAHHRIEKFSMDQSPSL